MPLQRPLIAATPKNQGEFCHPRTRSYFHAAND